MNRVVADVEREKKNATVRQDPPKLTQRRRQLRGLEMDHRVKGNDPRQRPVGKIEASHVPNPELEPRVELRCPANHFRRKVDSEHPHALIVEVPRDMARATTQVTDHATVAYLLREPVQQMPIQRLLDQLREKVLDIGRRDRVVARAQGVWDVTHSLLLRQTAQTLLCRGHGLQEARLARSPPRTS